MGKQCSMYSDREILAALQAVTVYWLLRISEPNDDATDFDIPLINTMLVLLHFNPSTFNRLPSTGFSHADEAPIDEL